MSNANLFSLMFDDHGLILTESEMEDIKVAIRKDKAKLIIQGRCSSCKHWDNSPWQLQPETRLCVHLGGNGKTSSWGFVEDCGPDFGCIHWEES
jgi:hypothetical protein